MLPPGTSALDAEFSDVDVLVIIDNLTSADAREINASSATS